MNKTTIIHSVLENCNSVTITVNTDDLFDGVSTVSPFDELVDDQVTSLVLPAPAANGMGVGNLVANFDRDSIQEKPVNLKELKTMCEDKLCTMIPRNVHYVLNKEGRDNYLSSNSDLSDLVTIECFPDHFQLSQNPRFIHYSAVDDESCTKKIPLLCLVCNQYLSNNFKLIKIRSTKTSCSGKPVAQLLSQTVGDQIELNKVRFFSNFNVVKIYL